ncbi:hypothetical protein [Arthrobacter sp. B2a2-09]|nr:hypothetical protein [Arthrobacter sp. B2a2-09]
MARLAAGPGVTPRKLSASGVERRRGKPADPDVGPSGKLLSASRRSA